MYNSRLIEAKLRRITKHFKAVLVVGARQVGKSTLLSHCFPELKHITFDALTDDYGARADPERFLNNFPSPIILDEIQYVAQLLSPLKRYIDQSNATGQYLMTGSQNLSTLKNAAESLAGRVAILSLDPMSLSEMAQKPQNLLNTYLHEPQNLISKFSGTLPLQRTLYEIMWRGAMPAVMQLDNAEVSDYYFSYLKTYVERDVRLLENVRNILDFERFVRLTAVLSGQEINYSKLGRELGIERATAARWLAILQQGYQWHEVPPYYGNSIKRLSRKNKGYIFDTGMACYLQRISSPDALASHPQLDGLFETFVSLNLQKEAKALNVPPYFYHWRTMSGAEVDLILERDGALYPIEIKCKSQIKKSDLSGLKAFRETHAKQQLKPALVIYAGNTCYEIADGIYAVPWNAFFA